MKLHAEGAVDHRMHEDSRAERGAETRVGAAGGGLPLTQEQRGYFEARFGADFSQVRLHTDASADAKARGLDALAFTRGSDIVFRKDQYRPENRAGRELLAHELTHVVQQQRGPAAIQHSRVEPVDSPAEREADRVAAQVAAGGQAPPIRHAPVGVPRTALTTNGGKFVMTTYDSADEDPGKNTEKKCGVEVKITFTPSAKIVSDQISFVQMMKAEKGGKAFLFENEKPRATVKGWAVDRLQDRKHADYSVNNDGSPDNTEFGYRKSKTDFKDAWMYDRLELFRKVDQTQKVRASSFALDKTNAKYLGGVAWGYDVNAKGVLTKTAVAVQSMGSPTGDQKSALKQWNAQAENKDVSKRNHPDQVKITVP